ncbi:retrotransposon protein, putative, ty1-copia subclass [Tanacetum coccineum]
MPMTILNTLEHLGKFDGKSMKEGYLLISLLTQKGLESITGYHKKGSRFNFMYTFLENQRESKGKRLPDGCFDLDLLTPSMNYIPVRKENYADSKEQGITCDNAEDLDDQQFIVHTSQPMPPEERSAAKEVKLSSEDQALHDELNYHKDQQNMSCLLVSYSQEDPRKSLQALAENWVGSDARRTAFNSSYKKYGVCDLPKAKVASELKQSDSFWHLHLSWAYCLSMDVKRAFLYGNIKKRYDVQTASRFRRSCFIQTRSTELSRHFMVCIKPQEHGLVIGCLTYLTDSRPDNCLLLSVSKISSPPRAGRCTLILYVDDILIMGNNIPMLQDVKSYLGRCFAMKDLGEAAYILGIKIYRDRSQRLISLCQSAYIEKILKQYHMENSKRRSIPMQEKLRLSKSQGASTPAKLKRMQNVPYASAVGSNYVCCEMNTKDMFLIYKGDIKQELRVSCYTDAEYLTDADDLKSQTGYVFVLNGGAVDWKNAKQRIFATSSAEAEYIAAYDASKEAVWVRKFISRLGVVPTIEEPINMYCDNTGEITIANESGITKGARHFRAKVHYLREVIEFGDIKLEKVHTYDNLADPFTKALAFPKHSEHTKNIGMLPASSFM